jgi:hypothetical protein
MRRSWLASLALVPALALSVTVGSSTHLNAAGGAQVREPLGAAAAAAARAGLRRALRAETAPVGPASSQVHRIGSDVAAANPYWSGYVADNSKGATYTQVTGTWEEPTIKCTSAQTQIAIFWVGLDGYVAPANTVEQAGSLAECFTGKPFYFTWWETWPGMLTVVTSNTPVQPRDTIVATVTYNAAATNFTMTVTVNPGNPNLNNINTTQPCPVAGACARQSAEWITEAPSGGRGYFPLPDFKSWDLTAGTASNNGAALQPISQFPTDQLTLTAANPWGQAQNGTYPLATPEALKAAGNAFTETWNNSY